MCCDLSLNVVLTFQKIKGDSHNKKFEIELFLVFQSLVVVNINSKFNYFCSNLEK